MVKELHLTDEQYLRVLRKMEVTVAQDDFKPYAFDSTFPGDKYTESNCGFCNDAYTDKDMALFPDQYPGRKSMKYRRENHRCPFDMRNESGILGWGSGCFSGCYLFRNREYDVQLMRSMVDHTIKVVT